MAESSEPGTDSWVADTHGRVMAMKESLRQLSLKIKNSLNALKNGKYGYCTSCGKEIEPQRLSAIPTAVLCIACSKKVKK
jgi:RNA polymerase-binding transcription factor DksA